MSFVSVLYFNTSAMLVGHTDVSAGSEEGNAFKVAWHMLGWMTSCRGGTVPGKRRRER